MIWIPAGVLAVLAFLRFVLLGPPSGLEMIAGLAGVALYVYFTRERKPKNGIRKRKAGS